MNIKDWPKGRREQAIFKSVYCHKTISRPELKNELTMKGATLYKTIDHLVEDGYLQIAGLTKHHSAGRRPEIISLPPDGGYLFSFALKRTEYHIALVDLTHTIISRRSFAVTPSLSPEEMVRHVYQEMIAICRDCQIDVSEIAAVGLALVGPLDFGQGLLLGPTHFSANNWSNVPIVRLFEDQFGLPVVFDTLARACLWGCYIPQLYKHYKDMAYFTVGMGIGSGFLLQENVIENKDNILDGLAHMTMEIGGRKCICGEYGCLEAYATTLEIPQMFKRELAIGHPSILQDLDNITFDMIAEGADLGDALCQSILTESGIIFAKAILNLLRLFHLEAIIIGGEIIEKSDYFFRVVCDHIHHKVGTLTIIKQMDENEILLKGIAVKTILPFFEGEGAKALYD